MARHLVPEPSDRSSHPVSAEPTTSPAGSREAQGEPSSSYERYASGLTEIMMCSLRDPTFAGIMAHPHAGCMEGYPGTL